MAQKPHMLERRRKAQLAAAKAPGKSYAYETPRNPAAKVAKPKDSWVTFVPKRSLDVIDKDVRLVSITDRWAGSIDGLEDKFKGYFHLPINPTMGDVFYNGDINTTLFEEFDAWVRSDLKTPIVVHCGEGMMRSPAVAEFLVRTYKFKPYYDYPYCPRHTGNMDNGVYRTLLSLAEELEVNTK